MIRLLLIAITILTMASCKQENFPHNIDNPETHTTVSIQNMSRDTIIVAYGVSNKDTIMYLMENDLAVGEMSENHTNSLLIELAIMFVIGLLAGGAIFSD